MHCRYFTGNDANMGERFECFIEITSTGKTKELAIERFRVKLQEYLEKYPTRMRVVWRIRPEYGHFDNHMDITSLWKCYARLIVLSTNMKPVE